MEGCVMTVTIRPCLDCLKDIITAGIKKVVYADDYATYPPDVELVYQRLIATSGVEMVRVSDISAPTTEQDQMFLPDFP